MRNRLSTHDKMRVKSLEIFDGAVGSVCVGLLLFILFELGLGSSLWYELIELANSEHL